MSIKIECRHHPIDASPSYKYEVQYRRQKLTTLIEKYMPEFDGVDVWIGGTSSILLTGDEVKSYRCKNGESFVFVPAVRGPTIGALVGWLAGGSFWATVVVSAAIGAGISYGVNALLAKKPGERPTPPGAKPHYAWAEGTTATDGIPMMLAFGKVPLAGNIISSYTDYDVVDASVVTDNTGLDEIRYALLSHGFGNYKGPIADSMVINGQPLASFAASITTQTKNGTADQAAPTAFSSHVNEQWINRPITNAGGAVTFTTMGSDFDSLALLFDWQARYIVQDGGYRSSPCGIKIEISVKDADTWFTLADYSMSANDDSIYRAKFLNTGTYTGGNPVAVSNGTAYDIRVTNTIIDPEDMAPPNNTRTLRKLKLRYIHEVISTGFTYPGQPMTSISAIATDEISGNIDIKETWETSVVNKVNTSIAYSNNPADIIHFLLTLPLITGSDPYVIDSYRGQDPTTITNYATLLAELVTLSTRCDELVSTADEVDSGTTDGTTANKLVQSGQNFNTTVAVDMRVHNTTDDTYALVTAIDSDTTLSLDTDIIVSGETYTVNSTEKRYEFNGVFAESTDQWEAIKVVCAACDCSLVPRGNGYKLLIHENWTGDPVALYSPGNMLAGSFTEEEISDIDKKSKFEMSILDSNADFADTLIPLYDSAAGHSAKTESIEGVGITNRTQAARELKRLANYNVGVTNRREFSVGLDGLSCEELDVVYVIPPDKDGGRVNDYNASTPTVVTLDKKPVQSAADTLVLRTYNPATTYDLVQAMTVLSVDGFDVTCTATPTVAPVADQTVWAFGPTADILSEWRVTSVTERNDSKAGIVHDIVTETNYDTEEADSWDPEISFNYNAYSIAKRVNNVPTFKDINSPIPPSSFSPYYDLPFATNRNIYGTAPDTVTWEVVDAVSTVGIGMSYRGTLSEVTAGSTTDKYIYWDPDAPTVYNTTDDEATAIAGNNYIIAINEAGVMYLYDSQAQSAVVQHEAAINFDTRNDRDGSAVTAPTIAGDNTAVTHTAADDGSCNLVFKWLWGGSNPDIDGFQVRTRQSTSSASYVIGTTTDEERTYTLPADQRSMILFGIPINQYITLGINAYRIVDPDIDSDGIILSTIAQPGAALEDPYQPAVNVGGSYTDALIVAPLIKTAVSGKRVQLDVNGQQFITDQTAVGVYGTSGAGGSNVEYGADPPGDGLVYGTGVLMYLYNFNNGVPIDISLEQTVGDMHYYDRASTPSGPCRPGDEAVAAGIKYICTTGHAVGPGTWTKIGTQT